MAGNFVNVYSQMFADMFKQRYQQDGEVAKLVTSMHGLVGDAYKLKYFDKLSMAKHGVFGGDIPSTAPTVTAPTMYFDNYELKLTIDEFEQKDFNANALQAFADAHAQAMSRAEDQVVIDAMVAGGATKQVAAGGTNMTVDKLKEARRLLGIDGVNSKLHLIMHWNNMNSLLGETEYLSSLFNAAKPLVNPGMSIDFGGFTLHTVGDYANINGAAGGLPVAANIRKCYAFASDSVVMGYRIDPKTRMVDVPQNARVETLSMFSAGAVVGDDRGIVEVLCDES